MPIIRNTKVVPITSSGGTELLPVTDNYQYYHIKAGGVTLIANMAISPDGTAETGMLFQFKFKGPLTLDGNTLTVFSQSIGQDMISGDAEIECYYNGTTWEVTVLPSLNTTQAINGSRLIDASVTETQIALLAVNTGNVAANAITTAKILDANITGTKLSASAAGDWLSYAGSFEAGEQTTVTRTFNSDVEITGYDYTVTKIIAATDDATITINTPSGTAIVITIPAGTALGTHVAGSISINNALTVGDELDVVYAKATAGGKVDLFLRVTKV